MKYRKFTFSYTMANTLNGRYNVAIGGTGIVNPATTYFYYGPNADLNNLILSSGAFDQAYATDTTSYSASVDYSVSNVTVTPTLSSMTINGGDTPINFAPETITYNAAVASGADSITVI